MREWYLVYSKPRQERIAQDNLRRQGYETYLPLIRQRRRQRGEFRLLVEPMFPRYLFIQLDDVVDNWNPIRSTIGVARLVRFGDIPAKVPAILIEALQGHEDENGVQRITEKELRKGEPVLIVDGAMAGYQAIFDAKSGSERVVLLLEIAGRSVPISLKAGDIQPIRKYFSRP
ncbi:MAG: transcription/translation regulatory transformer protein RfaH [Gammaproteobacteria bacterium]